MEITLPDGRKATVIGQVTDKMSKIRFEDGREVMWPTDKIPQPVKEGEDTLKLVVVPAIDRLEELKKDFERMLAVRVWSSEIKDDDFIYPLAEKLFNESQMEFDKKWGLISPKEKDPPTPNETSPMPI